MKIQYKPQYSSLAVSYSFDGEMINVVMDGVEDHFDFTGMPDGRVSAANIRTVLPVNPVISAVRAEGALTVNLIHFYGDDAEEWERTEREVMV